MHTFFIQRSAHHLNAFEYHFDHVLVAMVSGAVLYVVIQNKNIHRDSLYSRLSIFEMSVSLRGSVRLL